MSSEFFRKHHSKILLFLIGGVLCVGALTSCIRTMHLEIAEQEIKCEVRYDRGEASLDVVLSKGWGVYTHERTYTVHGHHLDIQ